MQLEPAGAPAHRGVAVVCVMVSMFVVHSISMHERRCGPMSGWAYEAMLNRYAMSMFGERASPGTRNCESGTAL